MPLRKNVLSLAVLLLASAPLALAQGTYTQIDVPGAIYTAGLGIDAVGDIVGLYLDASANTHGFLRSNGMYTTIDYPGATEGTALYGINDLGQIVGAEDFSVGFVYDLQTQTFTTVSYPLASLTFPTSINNSGTIVGFYVYETTNYGFEVRGSTYRQIKPPTGSNTVANGITALGDVVGSVTTGSGNTISFLLHRGNYQRLTVPNAPSAVVDGISPTGKTIVGVYTPSVGADAGFVYVNANLKTLDFPGSHHTYAIGINDAGEVVGYFSDASGVVHGFTWTPPADAAKK